MLEKLNVIPQWNSLQSVAEYDTTSGHSLDKSLSASSRFFSTGKTQIPVRMQQDETHCLLIFIAKK